jgi:sigma-B regulation protein RsbU (phosphoserine phosphatase)
LDTSLPIPNGELRRLYHETRQNELRLISDLDMAREVQEQLLPNGAREITGLELAAAFVPARELGGDFYDFLPYGSGRLAIALGDVSGKGTAAALLGALTIGILRAQTLEHAGPPAEVLALLNDRIHAARLDTRFVAMLFAVFDSNTRELTIANAGNPYPLLVRNGRIEQIPLPGIPLGLMPGTRYEPASLHVQLGDIVVFASDGVLECQNSEQEAFCVRHLAAALTSLPPNASAEKVSSTILRVTDAFRGHAPAEHDDRSLMVLKVTDESSADLRKFPTVY